MSKQSSTSDEAETQTSSFSDLKARFESLSRLPTPAPSPVLPSYSSRNAAAITTTLSPPTPTTPSYPSDSKQTEELLNPGGRGQRTEDGTSRPGWARQRSSSGPPLTTSPEDGNSEPPATGSSSMRASVSQTDLLDTSASGPTVPSQRSSPGLSQSPTPTPAIAAPPIPPASTRPTLPPPSGSQRKPPPPVPTSRRTPLSSTSPPTSATVNRDLTSARSPPSLPASAVKLLASRFTSSPVSTPQLSPARQAPAPRLDDSATANFEENPFAKSMEIDDGESRRGSSSSSSESVSPAPPTIPRRPSITKNSTEPIVRQVPPIPPRIPNGTLPPSQSTPLPSISPPSSSSLPPPPNRQAPPSRSPAPPPRISTTRPLPSPILPPSSSTSSPSFAPSSSSGNPSEYQPPPPPSRVIPPNVRLAPLRPALTSPGDDSSEEDEDDTSILKTQEFPDSTFANRRPPVLRNRYSIHSHTSFSTFAVRGQRVVTGGQNHSYIWRPSLPNASSLGISLPDGEAKIQALAFRPAAADIPGDDARFVWGGTKEGGLFELDTVISRISSFRSALHAHCLVGIFPLGRSMLTLDDSGKLLIFGSVDSTTAPDLTDTPKVQRIGEKQTFAAVLGNELWTSMGPNTKTAGSLGRSPQVRVFDPTGKRAFMVTSRANLIPEALGTVGSVTAGALLPHRPTNVYLAHDNGYISTWERTTYTCASVQRISPYGITGMVGVGRHLWCGFRTGFICVYDVENEFQVVKAWKAHKEAVTHILVDPASLWTDQTLQVVSSGSDMMVHLWDGLLRDDWLDHELHMRQREFCTYRTIRVLSVSWNVDAARPSDLAGQMKNLDFLQECLTSVDSPDIISFGFQEMIDLESKKLTAKSLLLGKKKTEQKFTDSVSSSYRLWHDKLIQAVRLVMPPSSPYSVVHVGDMVGLFSCIFVKNSERDGLRDVALTTVKTGMRGKYGNKGAILARFVIDDSSLCFINCHLAAGQSHRRQRDHDLVNILEERSGFSELGSSSPGAYSLGSGGTTVFDHEVCILSGDLNYRIDLRRDAVLKAVAEGALATLFPYDQLLKGLATNPTFRLRSFKEAPLTFAPTYKYDPYTDDYDGSAKKRIPAWCDRILWRVDGGQKVKPLHYRRYECNVSDHRPISAGFEVEVKHIIKEKRALVWEEVESAWFGVESDMLQRAREYYAGM